MTQPSIPSRAAIVARKLSRHSVLSAQAVGDLDRLLGQPYRYAAGALIAKVGDPADLVTVLEDGLCARTNLLPDGRRQIHSLFLAGDTADGEMPLLGSRLDNLEALSRCSVWRVPHTRMAGLIHSQPTLAEAFAREAAMAAQVAREWVVNIGRRTATERIAHLICELHARFEAIGQARDGVFAMHLTQQDIADAQGLSAVHVNRVMQDLRLRGLIRTERHKLAILDHDRLCKLAVGDFNYLRPSKAHADSPLLV